MRIAKKAFAEKDKKKKKEKKAFWPCLRKENKKS
jgi:hypothetical protein